MRTPTKVFAKGASMGVLQGVDSASEMESVKAVSSSSSVLSLKAMSFESQMDEPFANPEDGEFAGDPIPIPEWPQDVNKEIEHQLGALYKRTRNLCPMQMGYPGNLEGYPGIIGDVADLFFNNVGDPITGKVGNTNTRRFEVGVLHWFAALWHIDPKDMWGYITHGGTEANLQGLFMAREKFQNGILYTSTSAHYSIYKLGHILKIPFQKVEAQDNGEMDYDDLKRVLKMNAGSPAIINANMGTTMKGAVDNIDRIADALRECGYSRDEYYIHCDAALAGIMLPFIDSNILTFNKPIDSISVSGHKFLGIPFPCGVFMTRVSVKVHSNSFDYVDYVNSSDTTVSGSRNGHSSLYFWCIIAKKGYEGIKQEVMESLRKAQIMKGMLEQIGIECSVYENSNTVVFPCPSPELRKKWAIAPFGSKAHVITLQHVGMEKVEELVADLAKDLLPDFTVDSSNGHVQGCPYSHSKIVCSAFHQQKP